MDALLTEEPKKRKKWVQECSDRKLTDKVDQAVKEAETLEDLHVALDPVLDREATPDLVPQGAMVLQPSEERRRSGSHYTPRSLTEPIMRRTLAPILARLRQAGGEGEAPPTPEQILDLKVCDPAMGSGAFLVEACRQLGDALIESWHAHDALPELPPDEDEVIFARRLVAQRCLYGVDRAVLHAYGWDVLSTDCDFLLDYEVDEENWSPRKKKPYRFRWPEETHNEVLARLLELNAERGKAESLQGALF